MLKQWLLRILRIMNFYFFIKYFLVIIILFNSWCFTQQNKLFWDGRDWNQILKKMDYNKDAAFKCKVAYINGVLDGRLYGYLKTWEKNNELADEVFSETVDYLTNYELIRNIDFFYQDPLNNYIPIPSAILIANLYAERLPIQYTEEYIEKTRSWINELMLELDTLNYSKLLERKMIEHQQKQVNQYE